MGTSIQQRELAEHGKLKTTIQRRELVEGIFEGLTDDRREALDLAIECVNVENLALFSRCDVEEIHNATFGKALTEAETGYLDSHTVWQYKLKMAESFRASNPTDVLRSN